MQPTTVPTEGFEVHEGLERRIAQLEHENQAKAEFMALVSHELRTPLNSIMGYAELLLSGIPETLTPTARYQVERIRSSAIHQVKLVNEIIRYARAQSSTQRIVNEPVDLDVLIDDVVSLTLPAAAQKGLSLEVSGRDSKVVHTDATRVRQILLNLVWNAIKFTNAGKVEVRVCAKHDSFTVSVDDTGIGISDDAIKHIFEPFWREEKSLDDEDGVGLGLSVSRSLARLLGGDLTVASQVGSGSVFTVRIPCRIADGRPS
jgi:signal transduction histidine kinase